MPPKKAYRVMVFGTYPRSHDLWTQTTESTDRRTSPLEPWDLS